MSTMTLPDIRRHSGYLLLAVVMGQLILISAQVNAAPGITVLQAIAFGGVSAVQRAAADVVHGVHGVWTGYVALVGAQRENAALRRENMALRVKLQEQRALALEAAGLRSLLQLRERVGVSSTGAQVIAGSASPDFRIITIDKGRADGLKNDMAVLGAAGIVGRVVTVARRAAKVQLIVDRSAAAAALVERSRAEGIVLGDGDGLRLEYTSSTADIKEGDVVVTSGLDGIYPPGFAIGQVVSVGGTRSSRNLLLRPAVDFSRLEEVLVVLQPVPHAAVAEASR